MHLKSCTCVSVYLLLLFVLFVSLFPWTLEHSARRTFKLHATEAATQYLKKPAGKPSLSFLQEPNPISSPDFFSSSAEGRVRFLHRYDTGIDCPLFLYSCCCVDESIRLPDLT